MLQNLAKSNSLQGHLRLLLIFHSRPSSWPCIPSCAFWPHGLSIFLQILKVLFFGGEALPTLFYAWLTVPTSAVVLTVRIPLPSSGFSSRITPLGVSRQNDILPPLCSSILVTVLLLPLLAWLLCVATWSLAIAWVNTHRWPCNNSIHLCFIDGESLVQRGHVSSLWSQR